MTDPQPQLVIQHRTTSALSIVFQGLIALVLVGAGGFWAWQEWGPDVFPWPVDPNNPDVSAQVEAAAEMALLHTEEEQELISRERAAANRDREEIWKRLHEPFSEIDDILQAAPSAKMPETFGSLARGFGKGAGRVESREVARYGRSLDENFGTAAKSLMSAAADLDLAKRAGINSQITAKRSSLKDVYVRLQTDNHEAKERLIDAVLNAQSALPGFSGYLIDQEHRQALRDTSTWLPYMASRAPPEMDPRGWHHIENQGEMGSCQGHALSSVCEMAARISFREKLVAEEDGDEEAREEIRALGSMFERALQRRSDSDLQFSRLFAYYASQKRDGILGRGDVGSTLAGGLAAVMQDGICPEESMPYPNPVKYTGKFTPNAFRDAAPFKIRRHTVCRSYEDVYNFLASGQGGVEIGIRWPREWMECNGLLEEFTPGQGGHAVCFLGYTSKKTDRQGRRYLWLANSWGTGWGLNGFALVSPRAVDQMCQHQDTAMIGLSDLSKGDIRPRDVSWTGKGSVF